MYKVPLHWRNASSSPMFVRGSSWCLSDFSSASGCCVKLLSFSSTAETIFSILLVSKQRGTKYAGFIFPKPNPVSSLIRWFYYLIFPFFSFPSWNSCLFTLIRFVAIIVQSLSCVWLFSIPWTVARQAPLSSSISQSLLKFMFTESVMLSNHLVLCRPLLLLPSIFPSIRVFSNELALCITWSKYWRFSISPSNAYLALIPFRIDWFDRIHLIFILKGLCQLFSAHAGLVWIEKLVLPP